MRQCDEQYSGEKNAVVTPLRAITVAVPSALFEFSFSMRLTCIFLTAATRGLLPVAATAQIGDVHLVSTRLGIAVMKDIMMAVTLLTAGCIGIICQ